MEMELKAQILDVQDRAKTSFGQSEFYPEVFDIRAQEFIAIIEGLKVSKLGAVLDVGCGNGFYSSLWALLAERVIGIDEEEEALLQHSRGLTRARALTSQLAPKPVEIRHGCMQKIPLEDQSVDLLFSSWVLEHVMDVPAALKEACRVVKPGGIQVHVIPDFRDKIFTYLQGVRKKSAPKVVLKNTLRPLFKLLSFDWQALPFAIANFPLSLPPAHDLRKTFLQECYEYRLAWWDAHFKAQDLKLIQRIEMPRKIGFAYVLMRNQAAVDKGD